MSMETSGIIKDKTIVVQGTYDKAINYCDSVIKQYFEFNFCYVSSKEVFRELDRFIWESKHEMRFKNEYEGNVVIDLSAWNKREAFDFNEYFDAFFYYLKANKKINCLFIIDDYCTDHLLKKIKSFFDNVFPVDLHPKKADSSKTTRIGFAAEERGYANV